MTQTSRAQSLSHEWCKGLYLWLLKINIKKFMNVLLFSGIYIKTARSQSSKVVLGFWQSWLQRAKGGQKIHMYRWTKIKDWCQKFDTEGHSCRAYRLNPLSPKHAIMKMYWWILLNCLDSFLVSKLGECFSSTSINCSVWSFTLFSLPNNLFCVDNVRRMNILINRLGLEY